MQPPLGIIGIALILSLSNGFQIQIDEFEKSTLSQMPITISEQSIQLDEETMEEQMQVVTNDKEKYPTRKEVIPVDSLADSMLHQNIITEDYINYIEALDQSLLGGKAYQRATALNLITEKEDGTYQKVNTGNDYE